MGGTTNIILKCVISFVSSFIGGLIGVIIINFFLKCWRKCEEMMNEDIERNRQTENSSENDGHPGRAIYNQITAGAGDRNRTNAQQCLSTLQQQIPVLSKTIQPPPQYEPPPSYGEAIANVPISAVSYSPALNPAKAVIELKAASVSVN